MLDVPAVLPSGFQAVWPREDHSTSLGLRVLTWAVGIHKLRHARRLVEEIQSTARAPSP